MDGLQMNNNTETIDRKAIKSLASDTKVAMLKRLAQRRWMPSELSRDMSIAPSTVVEHLKALESAGLVKKEKTKRKWIYYALTERGENLFKPKIPFQFILSLTLGILITILGFWNFYQLQLQPYNSAVYYSGQYSESDTMDEVRDSGTAAGPTEALKSEAPPSMVAGASQNYTESATETPATARPLISNNRSDEFSIMFLSLAALGAVTAIATAYSIYRLKKLK